MSDTINMPRLRPNLSVSPFCPYCMTALAFPSAPMTGSSTSAPLAEYPLTCPTCGWRGYSPRFIQLPYLGCAPDGGVPPTE